MFDAVVGKPQTKEDFYRDIALIAFPLPQGGPLTGTTLRGTLPPVELAKLADSRPQTKAEFPAGDNRVEFVFTEPRTVRSVVCRNAARHKWEEDFPITMEVSANGQSFRRVSTFTANWDMQHGGATVLGPRPQQSPSLQDLGAGDARVRALAAELWNGRVHSGVPFTELFRRINLPPDVEWRASTPRAELLWVHRRVGEAEVYFVSNQRDRTEEVAATFRVAGKTPEWWDPATGACRALPEYHEHAGRITVPLRLDPCGSGFVVFRGQRAAARSRNWPEFRETQAIAGPWQVSFPPNLGAPAAVRLEKLHSLAEHSEPGIRFFSGTATYACTFTVAAVQSQTFLNLGDVQVIAHVRLNGRDLGILWKPPFRLEVTDALKPGANELEVQMKRAAKLTGLASAHADGVGSSAGRFSMLLTPFPGRLAEGLAETAVEIALVRKAAFGRYLRDGQVRLPQLPQGIHDPHPRHVSNEGHPRNLLEDLHELRLAHERQLRRPAHADALRKVLPHILEESRQPLRLLPMPQILRTQHFRGLKPARELIKNLQKADLASGLSAG